MRSCQGPRGDSHVISWHKDWAAWRAGLLQYSSASSHETKLCPLGAHWGQDVHGARLSEEDPAGPEHLGGRPGGSGCWTAQGSLPAGAEPSEGSADRWLCAGEGLGGTSEGTQRSLGSTQRGRRKGPHAGHCQPAYLLQGRKLPLCRQRPEGVFPLNLEVRHRLRTREKAGSDGAHVGSVESPSGGRPYT